MTNGRDLIFLKHIMEEIEKIEKSTKNISPAMFKKNSDIQDAVIRRIEVIGEAAKGVSGNTKSKFSDVEWKKIAGTRDILIHAYFSVDLNLTWEIIKSDIPKLKKQIDSILSDIEKERS